MSTEATIPTAIPEVLREKFRELALKVAHGDTAAEDELLRIEGRIAEAERQQRRREAAETEQHRLAVAAEEKRVQGEHQRKTKRHAQLAQQREAAFADIEQATAKLADAVREALALDGDIWALTLQLGWSPETRTASRITNYIGWQLGREGAGLSDMPKPLHRALRVPLAQ